MSTDCAFMIDGPSRGLFFFLCENSGLRYLSVEMAERVILVSLGGSETVKFVARQTQNCDSLQINSCHAAGSLRRSNRSRPCHFG